MPLRMTFFLNLYKDILQNIDCRSIHEELYKNQQIDISYVAMIIISALITTLGLIVNSPAVIIGAMIISPLMGPIMAGGLSFAVNDYLLGRSAFKSISLGVITSVVFAALVTLISLSKAIRRRYSPEPPPTLWIYLLPYLAV